MSTVNSLPQYEDDEVRVFHPICEDALNLALRNLKLQNDYEIRHHETVGNLEADFVLVRKNTGKYLLFLEVKRNPAAVSSVRYRIQAQSYVQEARTSVELPYYAITNLELLDIFKYDNNRPSVTQQIIDPSPIRTGFLTDNPKVFFGKLVLNFERMFDIVINDKGTYKELTGSFIPILEESKLDKTQWHQSLIVAGHEYIRGALNASNRRMSWKTALTYKNRPNKLIDNIKSINFNKLTIPPIPNSNDNKLWNAAMLEDISELGYKTMSGDDLAELIHSIAISGREHEGLVPTDLELANILNVLVKSVLGRDLLEGEVILDPAAGGGNLLASVGRGFQNIRPNQLWANDNETLFSELLSIRLGLMFPTVISPDNSPKVTDKDIIELENKEFENVKVILLNPPYVSGVKDPKRKKKVASRIYDITGKQSTTNVGQIGIEAPFLELINTQAKDDTIIGVVFPKQYLTTKGRESRIFREFLLNDFGLHTVFIYPREGIFEDVIKDTVVLIGYKNNNKKNVNVIKCEFPLANINISKMKQGLEEFKKDKTQSNIAYGLNIREVSVADLKNRTESGWTNLTVLGENTEIWIKNTLNSNSNKLSCIYKLKRGRIGNAGASDLLFINTDNKFWYNVQKYVPTSWLYPALRTVKDVDTFIVDSKTTRVRFLSPPDEAFIENTKEYIVLEKILDMYVNEQLTTTKNTGQRKNIKTKEELRSLLDKERKKITNEFTILIPRNIRRFARVFITYEKSYVSTNVIEVTGGSIEEKWIMVSWLQSVFSQLQFEGMAKDQEGTRKLEAKTIGDLLIPDIKSIDEKLIKKLINTTKDRERFLDLCSPEKYVVDDIWNEIMNLPESRLSETINLLEERVAERFPEYTHNIED